MAKASQSGSGGHSQLVFDDTPGGARIELSTTLAHTRLQLVQLHCPPGPVIEAPRTWQWLDEMVEAFDIKDVNEAYERVLKSDVRYRFVIDMATLKNAA